MQNETEPANDTLPDTPAAMVFDDSQRATLNCVTDEWEGCRDIHKRVGCWTQNAISHHLRELLKAGEIEGRITPWPNYPDQYRREYRRLQPSTST